MVQFGGTVAEATLPIRMQFIRKVYSILYASPSSLSGCVEMAVNGMFFYLQDRPNPFDHRVERYFFLQ